MFYYSKTHIFKYVTVDQKGFKKTPGRYPKRLNCSFCAHRGCFFGHSDARVKHTVILNAPQFKFQGGVGGPGGACETNPVVPDGRAENKQMAREG